MKSDIIHPFVESAVKVLQESTGLTVTRGDLRIVSSPMPTLGVASVIGITGEIDGRMVVDISRETACKLAAKMNALENMEYNDLVTSTINEIANIICGRAVSALMNMGHKLEITPPTLFIGNEMEVSNAQLDTVIIPLELIYGKVILNLAIRAK